MSCSILCKQKIIKFLERFKIYLYCVTNKCVNVYGSDIMAVHYIILDTKKLENITKDLITRPYVLLYLYQILTHRTCEKHIFTHTVTAHYKCNYYCG